jgi:hypothetical protein
MNDFIGLTLTSKEAGVLISILEHVVSTTYGPTKEFAYGLSQKVYEEIRRQE